MQEGLVKTAQSCVEGCPTGALADRTSELVNW